MKTRLFSYKDLRSIHFVSAVVFLWGLSDAIISFALPIQLEQFVNNLTVFGLLMGVSSLAGALSDPILGFISTRMRYLWFLMAGLFLSAVVAATALIPFTTLVALWLMIAWGLYYEFIEIAIFAYVSRHHKSEEQSRYFGIIYLFMNMAYVFGPAIAGYVLAAGTKTIYEVCLVCIGIALLFLPRLAFLHLRRERVLFQYEVKERYNLKRQLRSFRKVWRYAAIFFVAVFLYNVWDAFIWTLVPIQSIGGNAVVAGILTSIFTLPLAVLSGYAGQVADRFGRNVTFILGLFVASLFTLLFGLQDSVPLQIVTAAISSLGFAFAYPALMGETAREGQDHQSELGNMAAVQRLFVNGGFIFGPVMGGVFAKLFGIQHAFAILGLIMLGCFVPIAGALIHFHIHGRRHRSITAEFDL